MKILVTGANGFVGTKLCEVLKEQGFEPIAFTRQQATNFSDSYVYRGDIRNKSAVIEAVGIADKVVHLAGLLGTSELIDSTKDAVETNIIGSLNVFEACNLHGRECLNISVGNHDSYNTYSLTKYCAERFALMSNKELDTRICNVRLFNAYGPGQSAEKAKKLVPTVMKNALNNEPIMVHGTGDQEIDLVYINDVAQALVNLLKEDNLDPQRTYEIGSCKGIKVKDIAELIVKLSNSSSEITFGERRSGDTPNEAPIVASSKSLEDKHLKDVDFTPIEKGMLETIEWFKQQNS